MDKKTFEALRNKDIKEVEWLILDNIRSNRHAEDTLLYEVSFSALAYILKEVGSKDKVILNIKEKLDDETTLNFLNKVMSESFEQIYELSEKFEEDDLKAITLFAEPSRFTASDLNSTPEGVSKLAISLLEVRRDDTVLDLGSGVNSFLIQTGLSTSAKNLYGVEINTHCVIIANIRSLIAGLPIQVTQGNVISQDFPELEADKVFSNHPLGMRWTHLQEYVQKNAKLSKYFKGTKRTVSGDWVYSLAALLRQEKSGKTIVLMTNAGTWNKPDEEIRKRLVEEGIVEGVILLPSKLFSSTMIPLTMMVFSQDNKEVQMVDASDIFTEGRRQNMLEDGDIEDIIIAYHNETDISRTVPVKEIAEQEYILNPKRFVQVGPGIEDGIAFGDICLSINRGAMIKSSELDELASSEETNYHYLMLQNIQEGVVDSNLPNLTHIEKKYQKYCIQDKNLILSKISPFKVAMAHVKEEEIVLANGNLYFVELDETKINPVFVEVFLQSEVGMAQLNRLAKGTVMKSISIKDLKTIQIPNLPREEQDKIAEEYETLCDELVILQKQADMIRDKKARFFEEVV